jgi:hypothetical protein
MNKEMRLYSKKEDNKNLDIKIEKKRLLEDFCSQKQLKGKSSLVRARKLLRELNKNHFNKQLKENIDKAYTFIDKNNKNDLPKEIFNGKYGKEFEKTSFFKEQNLRDLIIILWLSIGIFLISSGISIILSNLIANFETLYIINIFDILVLISSILPAVPLPMNALLSRGLIFTGFVMAAIGLDIFFLNFGLWIKNKNARVIAIIFLLIAVFFNFVDFFFYSLNISILKILVNCLFIYFLIKYIEI